MGFQLSGEKENVCEQSAGRGFVGVKTLTAEGGGGDNDKVQGNFCLFILIFLLFCVPGSGSWRLRHLGLNPVICSTLEWQVWRGSRCVSISSCSQSHKLFTHISDSAAQTDLCPSQTASFLFFLSFFFFFKLVIYGELCSLKETSGDPPSCLQIWRLRSVHLKTRSLSSSLLLWFHVFFSKCHYLHIMWWKVLS